MHLFIRSTVLPEQDPGRAAAPALSGRAVLALDSLQATI